MDAACLYEAQQSLDATATARAEAAAQRNIGHAEAPVSRRELVNVIDANEVDVGDDAVRTGHL